MFAMQNIASMFYDRFSLFKFVLYIKIKLILLKSVISSKTFFLHLDQKVIKKRNKSGKKSITIIGDLYLKTGTKIKNIINKSTHLKYNGKCQYLLFPNFCLNQYY